MRITIENYILESTKESGYHLIEVKPSEAKKAENGSVESILFYNLSIPRALKKMVHLNLHNVDNTVDFEGFLRLYTRELDRMNTLLQTALEIA
jgi:hypothetical protein